MGDRHYLQLKCAKCGKKNPPDKDYQEDPLENCVMYAPSCGFMDFKCQFCQAINWIENGFYSRVVTPKELTKLYKKEGFE